MVQNDRMEPAATARQRMAGKGGTGEFVCFWLSVVLIGPKQHHVYICHLFFVPRRTVPTHIFGLPRPPLPLPLSPARTSLQVGRTR